MIAPPFKQAQQSFDVCSKYIHYKHKEYWLHTHISSKTGELTTTQKLINMFVNKPKPEKSMEQRFKKCQQLFKYQHLLLPRDTWGSKI